MWGIFIMTRKRLKPLVWSHVIWPWANCWQAWFSTLWIRSTNRLFILKNGAHETRRGPGRRAELPPKGRRGSSWTLVKSSFARASLPFIYFGTFTSLPHGMQDRLHTIRSNSAYLKMIRKYDLSLPADDPRRKELPGWPCLFFLLCKPDIQGQISMAFLVGNIWR